MFVEHHGQKANLPLVLVRTTQKCEILLLGRDWLEALKLDWMSVCRISLDKVATLIQKFGEVFEPTLGFTSGFRVKLTLKDATVPVFCKARTMAFTLRDGVAQELETSVESGGLVPIQQNDWAMTLVVPKPNGKVRICGDYKSD